MREYFDDFNDIEFDDNEIIDRLMREWEMEERRKVTLSRRGPGSGGRRPMDDDDDFDGDYDDDYDDYDDDDDDDENDYDDDNY